jgi:replicative DNA helicase
MAKMINNSASERAVLSGILQHGSDAFIDVDDIITVDTFTLEENQIIYACIKRVLINSTTVDLPSILSAANDLGLESWFENQISSSHIGAMSSFDISLENVRHHAIKLKKLEIARQVSLQAKQIISNISDITGDESVDEIINVAEAPIFELSASLNSSVEDKPSILGDEVEDYIRHLEENPSDILGLSSGFAKYDAAIGGGFRRKCVDLIAARPKVGKSMLAGNVAMHIAGTLNVPVLFLDTEMSKEDHMNRLIAKNSGVNINDIAAGRFVKNSGTRERVRQAVEKLKNAPLSYIAIAGKPFEETLSIMRRWIIKNVGYDENGRVNDCIIIFDYLKLMTSDKISNNMQEFQVLGFQITELHNFCVKYDCPCLSFVQLNRDGITKESTDVVSGSDRLIWLCSSFSIFKRKSDEEIAEDQGESGNRKLIPIEARHGPGLEDYDYINIAMQGSIAEIVEKETKSEVQSGVNQHKEGFLTESVESEESPF